MQRQRPNKTRAKQREARSHMSQLEINNGTNMYLSMYWKNRKALRIVKILKSKI